MRYVVVKFTKDGCIRTGTPGSRQANDMSFLSWFHCLIGVYRGNMEQGVQQELTVQTPNNH
jgi:hypothetical protein